MYEIIDELGRGVCSMNQTEKEGRGQCAKEAC